MSRTEEIRQALERAFQPQQIEVTNESAKHRGHAGDDGSGESHFHVLLRAPRFASMSRLERHRAVHGALGEELLNRIHALSLDIDG